MFLPGLLDLAHSLWFEMKEDLYHTFSFISNHFTPETLQKVYDLCKDKDHGILPWELVGTAIYLQAGMPPQEIGKQEWKDFQILSTPNAPDTLSTMGICTVREHGAETRFYTLHFRQFVAQELLDAAAAQAGRAGITVTEAIQRFDYRNMQTASVEANKAVYGPESSMAEKLSRLMASSPITAGHITIDVDSGSVAIEVNPLWEKLRDEREAISVEEYTYGPLDELRVNKTYQLSLSDDPSLIPTEDFVRNGRRYFLLARNDWTASMKGQRRGTLYLRCEDCGMAVTLPDSALLSEVNRQMAEHDAPNEEPYTPSGEVVRLTNAINRGLEHPDKPEDVVSLILRGASARYDCCPTLTESEPFNRPAGSGPISSTSRQG